MTIQDFFPEKEPYQLPEKVGKYEVGKVIGEGGMASVYLARMQGPAHISKEVALKLIHPHLSRQRDFILMFLDEMRVAMSMSHRNIVHTFDAGKHKDTFYMVIELMDGGSLEDLLLGLPAGTRLPLDLSLFIAMEICSALDYAHNFGTAQGSSGVIHRDVSPGNILLSSHGDVKLADFGIAKAAGRLSISGLGTIKGKLSYMAPEQANGIVDQRSDLFSVGVVLFKLIAGKPLRKNPNVVDVRSNISEDPERLLHAIDGDERLKEILLQCLAKDPSQRPESAARLRQLLSDELFRLQQNSKAMRDSHARLCAFLTERQTSEDTDDENVSRQIEAAMLKMALAVPTQHGERGAEALAAPDMGATAITSHMIPPAGLPKARQQNLLMLSAIGLLLLALGMLWLVFHTSTAHHVVVHRDLGTPRRSSGLGVADAFADRLAHSSPLTPLNKKADASAPPTPDGATRSRSPRLAVPRSQKKRRFGTLDVNASPWAIVFIDGKKMGETPIQGLRLSVGGHRLRLYNPVLKLSRTLSIQILHGRRIRKSVRMTETAR